MTLRTSDLWKMRKFSDQWPFGLTIRRTNDSWDHWTNFRTNEPSDNKPFGPMTVLIIDHSDLWNNFRTNDPSDYWPVGLLTIRTSARFSDQWTLGPTIIRNIELSPYPYPTPMVTRHHSDVTKCNRSLTTWLFVQQHDHANFKENTRGQSQ